MQVLGFQRNQSFSLLHQGTKNSPAESILENIWVERMVVRVVGGDH